MSKRKLHSVPPQEEPAATDEQPAQRLEDVGPVLQIIFHAPDGTPIMGLGCPAGTVDETGVHLPALVVLQQLFANYTGWQNAQPKPSGLLVPNGHAQLSVAQQNDARIRDALQQQQIYRRPRPGKRSN